MITTKDILSVSESGRVLHYNIDMLTAYRGFGFPAASRMPFRPGAKKGRRIAAGDDAHGFANPSSASRRSDIR
jgi:hypothetical protein